MYCFISEPFSAKTPEEIHRIRNGPDSYYAPYAAFPSSYQYQACTSAAPISMFSMQPISSPIMPFLSQQPQPLPQLQPQPQQQLQPQPRPSVSAPILAAEPVPPAPKSPPKQTLPAPKELKNGPASKRSSTPVQQRTSANAKSPARVLSSSSPRAASAPPKSKRNSAQSFAESSATAVPAEISLPPVPGSPAELQATPLKKSSPPASQRSAAAPKPPPPYGLAASAGRPRVLPPIPTTNCVMA